MLGPPVVGIGNFNRSFCEIKFTSSIFNNFCNQSETYYKYKRHNKKTSPKGPGWDELLIRFISEESSLFWRTSAQLPSPTLGGSQVPITPAPGVSDALFWPLRAPAHTCCTLTQTHTCRCMKIIKIFDCICTKESCIRISNNHVSVPWLWSGKGMDFSEENENNLLGKM